MEIIKGNQQPASDLKTGPEGRFLGRDPGIQVWSAKVLGKASCRDQRLGLTVEALLILVKPAKPAHAQIL